MNCHYCGAEVNDREVFCCNCGTRQNRPVKAAVETERYFEEEFQFPEQPDDLAMELTEPVSVPKIPAPAPAESRPAYVPYGAPVQEAARKTPMLQLPTERSLPKMIFLGIITLGIYPLVIWCRIVTELNIAASRYDGERTMSYLGAWMLAPVTLCIYPIVWIHGFCRRIGAELNRRGIYCEFGPGDFWLWNVLGSFILVGPFVFVHKLMKAMNMINKDFNVNG